MIQAPLLLCDYRCVALLCRITLFNLSALDNLEQNSQLVYLIFPLTYLLPFIKNL